MIKIYHLYNNRVSSNNLDDDGQQVLLNRGCFIIQNQNTKDVFVLDTGYSNWAENRYIPFIKEVLKTDKVKAIVVSHTHSDHIDGVIPMIDNLNVENLYESGFYNRSSLMSNLPSKTSEKGVNHVFVNALDEVTFGNIKLQFFHPFPDYAEGRPYVVQEYPEPHETHLTTVRVEYGDFSFLYPGDIGPEFMKQGLLNAPQHWRKSTYMNALYHALPNNFDDELTDIIDPEIALLEGRSETGNDLVSRTRNKYEAKGVSTWSATFDGMSVLTGNIDGTWQIEKISYSKNRNRATLFKDK